MAYKLTKKTNCCGDNLQQEILAVATREEDLLSIVNGYLMDDGLTMSEVFVFGDDSDTVIDVGDTMFFINKI